MPNDPEPSRQPKRQVARTDAQERAKALVARLEQQVAATANQRAVLLGAIDHAHVVEPHRDHHAYHLGADLFYCGLATGDATAFMGLMSTGPTNIARLLAEAARTQPNVYVARLWPAILDAHRDEYEARGRFVQWQRRWAMYKEQADAWVASDMNTADGSWRTLHMTSGQRHLVRDLAVLLDLDLPAGMDRGQAHDWLAQNGAHVVYRRQS